MVGKSEVNLFETLIDYHISKNLKAGLEREVVDNGKMFFQDRTQKVPVKVGRENGQSWYRGVIIFANGADLVDKMKGVGLIRPSAELTFQSAQDKQEICDFLDKATRKDGAVIYDRESKRVTRTRLNNYMPGLEDIAVEAALPKDYLSESASVPLQGEDGSNVGCRSELGVTLSQGITDTANEYHKIDAYLIKHTIYNPLGFGPVVHIGKEEMELFFFRHDPEHKGRFLNAEHKIVGVYRSYRKQEGKFTLEREMLVEPGEDGKLNYIGPEN